MTIGTTFDIDQAKALGLNWKKALKQLCNLNISPIRIGIKWNRVEYKRAKYNWDDYDTIFKIITSENISTILALGVKAPRWPEFYIPDWPDAPREKNATITNEHKELRDNLYKFINSTIQRFNNLAMIKYIQVENEPLLRFGPLNRRISYNFLKDEVQFVQSLTNKPIILTDSGLPTTGVFIEYLRKGNKRKKQLTELADIVGLNVFPRLEAKILKRFNKTLTATKNSWDYLKKWHDKIKAAGKKCWISELQAEPWESGKINYKNPCGNKTCNPKMVQEYLNKLQQIGFETILVWGSEFHIKCEKEGNPEWIKSIYSH